MQQFVDLKQYPLDGLSDPAGLDFIAECQNQLEDQGMFNLVGFLHPEAIDQILSEVVPLFDDQAFKHARRHNIYFDPDPPGLAADHPARQEFQTFNHTICADQIADSLLCRLYEWPPMRQFLAAVMGKPELHLMADPLARVNVMAYEHGEALNWHFDRSEFTTTILLQSPQTGGEFQYCRNLRTDDDPNYDGVAQMLAGQDKDVVTMALEPGTLNIFRGKNTAHRVTDIEGDTPRVITVFSYFEEPGRLFSDEERLGFYGRV